MKICKDLQKYVKPAGSSSGPWPQNMVVSVDRTLGEISRILDKQVGRLAASAVTYLLTDSAIVSVHIFVPDV